MTQLVLKSSITLGKLKGKFLTDTKSFIFRGDEMPKVSDEYFEQKRKEIVDAAYRVCMKKPITSVEMKDIIAETGFSHGVIYRYYSELDEVLQDLVIRINRSNRIDERLMEILDRYKARLLPGGD